MLRATARRFPKPRKGGSLVGPGRNYKESLALWYKPLAPLTGCSVMGPQMTVVDRSETFEAQRSPHRKSVNSRPPTAARR